MVSVLEDVRGCPGHGTVTACWEERQRELPNSKHSSWPPAYPLASRRMTSSSLPSFLATVIALSYLIASRIPPGPGGSIARNNDKVQCLGGSWRLPGRLWGSLWEASGGVWEASGWCFWGSWGHLGRLGAQEPSRIPKDAPKSPPRRPQEAPDGRQGPPKGGPRGPPRGPRGHKNTTKIAYQVQTAKTTEMTTVSMKFNDF